LSKINAIAVGNAKIRKVRMSTQRKIPLLNTATAWTRATSETRRAATATSTHRSDLLSVVQRSRVGVSQSSAATGADGR
jgi:hypothetical protein